MRKLDTEILVLGGGATGTGVARDLAMRGFKTILLEKGDLTHGTTGRYHGLLHSGSRYVVKDPQAAKECIEENRILRRIMPHCIEDTGGFYLLTPWDDPAYAPRFIEGCRAAGIPLEEISTAQMLREEPLLNSKIMSCFRVPDASADSFLGADSNAASARQYGAQIILYHKALQLIERGDKVVGARAADLVNSEEIEISADIVVNAMGAWAGQITATIGVPVHIVPGKGVMIAVNHRIVNTVVNRCRMPSDGDLIVPAHSVAVMGTTDTPVADPDHFAVEPWEVQLMLEEGDKMVPGFSDMRILRAWAGVRPLYKETSVSDTREVTRAYVLLDHEKRDGVKGLVTITSGKWTTYRKMAEVTADLVCQKLGVQRPCRTAEEALPGAEGHARHYLGRRLSEIEKEHAFGKLVCECELAVAEDVEKSILAGAQTIDDVRRDVRLGMGPCQGGFCTYRVAGMLHTLRSPHVEDTNAALRDFLQERWKGLMPILWGQQLRQERLDQMIYLSLLNTDALPGPQSTPLASEMYEPGDDSKILTGAPAEETGSPAFAHIEPAIAAEAPEAPSTVTLDVLVIGAGLAGLTAAWQASIQGQKTRLVTKGWGSIYWNAGCIDVLGYDKAQNPALVKNPAAVMETFILSHPEHPYAKTGSQGIQDSLLAFQAYCAAAGYPMHGSLEKNFLLPSAAGAIRPTCLAPETMVAGDLEKPGSMLIAGFKHFPDYYPAYIAANLRANGVEASDVLLDLPVLGEENFVTGRVLALYFERSDFRSEVVKALRPHLGKAARIGFPAVLGIEQSVDVMHDLEKQLGLPVFEIPTLPPSIPGMRLSRLLIKAIEKNGGRVYEGMQAVGAHVQRDPNTGEAHILSVQTDASARLKTHAAHKVVLATGGLLGGGARAEYTGVLKETVFNLPLQGPARRSEWLRSQFVAGQGHPIFKAGLQVNRLFQPVDERGQALYDNLTVAGAALGGWDGIVERSLEGVALSTGYLIGKKLLRKVETL